MPSRIRLLAAVLTVSLTATFMSFGAGVASAATQVTTNSCQNNATGTFSDIDFTHTGTATPNPATLGVDTVTLPATTTVGAFFPAAVLTTGYNLGLLDLGPNSIPGDMVVTLNGTNTVEGSQTLAPVAILGQTTIGDPDGTPGTNDETATPLEVTITIPATTWTPTGGDIELSDGGSVTSALVAGGIIKVVFTCAAGQSVNVDTDVTPGDCSIPDNPEDCTSRVPGVALPFEAVAVVVPPSAPLCTDTAASVSAGEIVTVDLAALCSDVDDDLDPTTFAVTDGASGTTTVDALGVATYTNSDTTATTDSFTFTVADTGGLVSAAATATITIEPPSAPLCTDTAASVNAGEIVTVDLAALCSDVNDDLDPTTFAVTDGASGTTTVDAAGLATYTNTDGTAAADTFTFTVADTGGLVSEAATATITIVPLAAPVCTDPAGTVNALEAGTIDLAAVCSDVNGDLDPSTFVVTDGASGTTTVDAAGLATYTNTDGTAAADTFTFTVADTGGLVSAAATATITIEPAATTTTTTTTVAAPTTVPATTTSLEPLVGSGTSSFTTVCTNSATPDESDIRWTARGAALTSFNVGDVVELRGQRWNVTVNGSTFDTGINLKLIAEGDIIKSTVDVTVIGSNTAEGSKTHTGISISVPVVLGDDGLAKDQTASFRLPNSSWTATGKPIIWTPGAPSLSVIIPILPLPLTFTCDADAAAAPILNTDAPQVLGENLAFTGINGWGIVLPIALSLILLDLGYMAWSATKSDRRRFL